MKANLVISSAQWAGNSKRYRAAIIQVKQKTKRDNKMAQIISSAPLSKDLTNEFTDSLNWHLLKIFPFFLSITYRIIYNLKDKRTPKLGQAPAQQPTKWLQGHV